jgi:hypothetical protein
MDVVSLVAAATSKIKKWKASKAWSRPQTYDPKFKTSQWIASLPDFSEGYKAAILEHEKVAPHAEADYFPYGILKSKAPNQDEKEWEYQMHLYESVTNSDWGRALNKTKAVGNKQNYNIKWSNPDQKKYFYEDYPLYQSVESFFMDIVREEKINYPNKLMVVEPEGLNYYETEDGVRIDDTEAVSPVVRIYEEFQTIYFKERSHALVLVSMDEHYTDTLKNEKHDGLRFRYFDTTMIMDIVQVGEDEKKNPVYEFLPAYVHGWGWLPCTKLKGPSKIIGGEVVYQSAFASAIPDLNEVIRINSTSQVSIHTQAFPVRIMVVDPCDYNDGQGNSCGGGNVWSPIEKAHVSCPSCKGSGKKSLGPTSVIEVLARDPRPGAGPTELPTDPLKFVAPDPTILEYLDKRIEKHRNKAFSMFFDTDKATSETATGKQLEKEEWQTFMAGFARELFGLLGFAIEAIGFMRFGANFAEVEISYPKTFNFRTPESITAEIATAKKEGLPATYQKALTLEAVETRFGSDKVTMSDIELQMAIDKLWYMDALQVRAGLGVTISTPEALLHQNFTTYLEQARIEDEGFDELDTTAKRAVLLALAQVDNLIINPAAAAIDGGAAMAAAGADSTGALRGSVGGLTGMIEIVKAVASGLYDLDAAVSLVMDRFGLTEEQAKAQLGTPNATASVIEDVQDLNI